MLLILYITFFGQYNMQMRQVRYFQKFLQKKVQKIFKNLLKLIVKILDDRKEKEKQQEVLSFEKLNKKSESWFQNNNKKNNLFKGKAQLTGGQYNYLDYSEITHVEFVD